MATSKTAIGSSPSGRRDSRKVLIWHGQRQIWVGGDPVVVQSMTNTGYRRRRRPGQPDQGADACRFGTGAHDRQP